MKMRVAFVSYLFSIVLLLSRGILSVVYAEPAVRTIAAQSTIRDDDKHNFLNENGDHLDASCSSSSISLCLRPLTARNGVYLRTLSRRHHDDDEKNFGHGSSNYCWQSSPATNTMVPPSKSSLKIAVASLPSTVRLGSNNPNNENVEKQSLALKLDLLFATTKVQNNEIPLPRSIAELQDKMEFSSLAQSRLPPNMELSSRAAARVNLSGRWRPSTTAQDLTDYDQFLQACCSDKISYWTRQLLSSSSVVSRQEFIVKQLEDGRVLEMVDIHPLASSVWNRTIITNTIPNHSYVNKLKGPQENLVLIEAYWEENGSVHTSSLRMVEDDDTGEDNGKGWLRTRLRLFPTRSETQKDKTREMVVETTYHSTLYPIDAQAMLKAGQGEDASTTKMVWKWEEVIESSR